MMDLVPHDEYIPHAALLPWRHCSKLQRQQFLAHRRAQSLQMDLLWVLSLPSLLSFLRMLWAGELAGILSTLASLAIGSGVPIFLLLCRPATYTTLRTPLMVVKRLLHVFEVLSMRTSLPPTGILGRMLVLSCAAPATVHVLGAPLSWFADLLAGAASLGLASWYNASYCSAGEFGDAEIASISASVDKFSRALLAATMPQRAASGAVPCAGIMLFFQLAVGLLLSVACSYAKDVQLWKDFRAVASRTGRPAVQRHRPLPRHLAEDLDPRAQVFLILAVVMFSSAAAWQVLVGFYL